MGDGIENGSGAASDSAEGTGTGGGIMDDGDYSGNVDQGSDGEVGDDSAPMGDSSATDTSLGGVISDVSSDMAAGTGASDTDAEDNDAAGGIIGAIIAIIVVVVVIIAVIALMPKKPQTPKNGSRM